MQKIITENIYPPIPDRRFDWQATYDGDEPNDNGSMAHGFGRTEIEAINDLCVNFPREDVACPDCDGKGGVVPGITCANCEGSGIQPIVE